MWKLGKWMITAEYLHLTQIKVYLMNSQRAASYCVTPHTMDAVDWLFAEERTIFVLIFMLKGLNVLLKLSTSTQSKCSHHGEIVWSVNHGGATTQWMGNSIFGNHGKTLFIPKYSGVFDLRKKRKRLVGLFLKDSFKNLQDQIHYSYKNNCSWLQHKKRPVQKHLIGNFPLVLKFEKSWEISQEYNSHQNVHSPGRENATFQMSTIIK